uniref:Neuron navigator 1 n=1 Tax=Scleropages formosus TaxID=113540 RepID=A0A8C9SMH7_SCLFO
DVRPDRGQGRSEGRLPVASGLRKQKSLTNLCILTDTEKKMQLYEPKWCDDMAKPGTGYVKAGKTKEGSGSRTGAAQLSRSLSKSEHSLFQGKPKPLSPLTAPSALGKPSRIPRGPYAEVKPLSKALEAAEDSKSDDEILSSKASSNSKKAASDPNPGGKGKGADDGGKPFLKVDPELVVTVLGDLEQLLFSQILDPESQRKRTVQNVLDLRQNLEDTMSSLRGSQLSHSCLETTMCYDSDETNARSISSLSNRSSPISWRHGQSSPRLQAGDAPSSTGGPGSGAPSYSSHTMPARIPGRLGRLGPIELVESLDAEDSDLRSGYLSDSDLLARSLHEDEEDEDDDDDLENGTKIPLSCDRKVDHVPPFLAKTELLLCSSSWDESSSISSGLSDASDNLSSEEFNASSSLNSLPTTPVGSRRNSAVVVSDGVEGLISAGFGLFLLHELKYAIPSDLQYTDGKKKKKKKKHILAYYELKVIRAPKSDQKALDKSKLAVKTSGLQRSCSDAGKDRGEHRKPPSGIARPAAGGSFGYKKTPAATGTATVMTAGGATISSGSATVGKTPRSSGIPVKPGGGSGGGGGRKTSLDVSNCDQGFLSPNARTNIQYRSLPRPAKSSAMSLTGRPSPRPVSSSIDASLLSLKPVPTSVSAGGGLGSGSRLKEPSSKVASRASPGPGPVNQTDREKEKAKAKAVASDSECSQMKPLQVPTESTSQVSAPRQSMGGKLSDLSSPTTHRYWLHYIVLLTFSSRAAICAELRIQCCNQKRWQQADLLLILQLTMLLFDNRNGIFSIPMSPLPPASRPSEDEGKERRHSVTGLNSSGRCGSRVEKLPLTLVLSHPHSTSAVAPTPSNGSTPRMTRSNSIPAHDGSFELYAASPLGSTLSLADRPKSMVRSGSFREPGDDVHGSVLSLASSASSSYSSQIRKLRRELESSQEKVANLTTQLSANANLVAAFEQSLTLMTTRLQTLSASAEQKDSELIELRETIEVLKAKNVEAQAVIHGALSNPDIAPKELRIKRQNSSESISSLNSITSHSSIGSCKDADAKKKKKKSWLRSSFNKAFSIKKGPKSTTSYSDIEEIATPDSSAPSSPKLSHDGGDAPPTSLKSSTSASSSIIPEGTEEPESEEKVVSELRSELWEKEMKLTDIRLEALNSAHQLEQLREAMNNMQMTVENLKAENDQLKTGTGPTLNSGPLNSTSQPSGLTLLLSSSPRQSLTMSLTKSFSLSLNECSGPGWFQPQIILIKFVGIHSLTCLNSWLSGFPLFPGLKEKCVDSLVFETLIPKPMMQHYISLLLKHRRLILSGPSGTGKTYLTSRLAEYLVERSGREATEGIAVTYNMHRQSCKDLQLYLSNLANQIDLESTGDIPLVVILDDLSDAAAISELVNSALTCKYHKCPYVIGTTNQPTVKMTSNHGLHLSFRMVTFSNNVEPANGFLVRYLHRKLVEAENESSLDNEDLLRVLDWVPKLWYHLHTFLEKQSTSDFLIGPCFFLSCPVTVDEFRSWFIDLWNHSIIPYLQEGAKDGIKVHGQKAAWEDPVEWVRDTLPWPSAQQDQAKLFHLPPPSMGPGGMAQPSEDRTVKENPASCIESDPLMAMLLKLQEAANYIESPDQETPVDPNMQSTL